jgi:hypothetical protein
MYFSCVSVTCERVLRTQSAEYAVANVLRIFMAPAKLVEQLSARLTTLAGRESVLKAVRLIASVEAVFKSSNPERRAHVPGSGAPAWQFEVRELRKVLVKAGIAGRLAELCAATAEGGRTVDAELRMWATAALGLVRLCARAGGGGVPECLIFCCVAGVTMGKR